MDCAYADFVSAAIFSRAEPVDIANAVIGPDAVKAPPDHLLPGGLTAQFAIDRWHIVPVWIRLQIDVGMAAMPVPAIMPLPPPELMLARSVLSASIVPNARRDRLLKPS